VYREAALPEINNRKWIDLMLFDALHSSEIFENDFKIKSGSADSDAVRTLGCMSVQETAFHEKSMDG
jgi:hypothetical protein